MGRRLIELSMAVHNDMVDHRENLTNFDQLPPHGFKLSTVPVKWVNTTAAPVRAVAILES